MELGESKAVQILNTYLKFCKALEREGKITDENFNRIRYINGCINGQQDEIREIWGDLFDELYCLLQQPEIKLRLEQEQRELQNIRQNKKIRKQKSDKQKSLSNVQSKTNLKNQKAKNNFTNSSKKVDARKKYRINQPLIINKNSQEKKQKQEYKFQFKKKNQVCISYEKSPEQIRKIFWISVARAKQQEENRKKMKKQNIQPIQEVAPLYTFDDSSIFEDIMDERRAEGKGYGGSK
ncbi:hypothetical protein [Nostoc sp. PCC 7107]|uniref:hypothetical protein n=1 Tax=Nostoc sp. PCC 7107 TaxID=317936 RepID=UPI00029F2745|nr:hypothetical protein [Nostoc sp. PCC 7107]AFY43946.1 hypothetical protein Nos7107_3367 [Nostoc sp. PCC 7107]